jgi:hypothetical protein
MPGVREQVCRGAVAPGNVPQGPYFATLVTKVTRRSCDSFRAASRRPRALDDLTGSFVLS